MNKIVPVLCLILFAGIAFVAIRGRSRPDPRLAAPETAPAASTPVAAAPSPTAAPTPAPIEVVRAAADQVRIRATYQNYRAAIAVNNAAMQAALLPVLLRDRKSAEAFAEADLARATDDHDRSVTQKTLEALRR